MPYGKVTVERSGERILIVIDPPDRGEPSSSGRSENLVDPTKWIRHETSEEHLALKITVCRLPDRRFKSRVG